LLLLVYRGDWLCLTIEDVDLAFGWRVVNDGDVLSKCCNIALAVPWLRWESHVGLDFDCLKRRGSRADHRSPLVHWTMTRATIPVWGLTDKSVP
jgi:hypothetical protein